MRQVQIGLACALAFVALESVQFVYFGGLFQQVNSFFFAAVVIGTATFAFIGVSWLRTPGQIKVALMNWQLLLKINVTASFAWVAFLGSVQLIEPAIAYTIGAGVMPLTAWALYLLGWPEGSMLRNLRERLGLWLIIASMIGLTVITLNGQSGFVRAGYGTLGIALAVADGVFFTLLLAYCQRLAPRGVGASAMFGLRFVIYVVFAAAAVPFTGGIGAPLTAAEMVMMTVIGLGLTVPPLYALQIAVERISTLTLSAITATGPLMIFVLQIFEGRVGISGPTLYGLLVFFAGALVSALGAIAAENAGRDTG